MKSLDVINQFGKGEQIFHICLVLGLTKSALHAIHDNAEKLTSSST
jgi:hypothetical protein